MMMMMMWIVYTQADRAAYIYLYYIVKYILLYSNCLMATDKWLNEKKQKKKQIALPAYLAQYEL